MTAGYSKFHEVEGYPGIWQETKGDLEGGEEKIQFFFEDETENFNGPYLSIGEALKMFRQYCEAML